MTTIRAADLFCGAGGTSSGLARACTSLGLKLRLLAINHWNLAIETHSLNHPWADHLCESIDSVDPRKAVPGGRLNILVASPECTHHSIARGGKPINDQSRATAWHVLRWAEALRIDSILIENVREFQTWGPIGVNGRPMKSRRGETYRAFLQALCSLGYQVQDRVLNAADFGDPTTRERLFILAKRGRSQIRWPQPTHTPDARTTLWGKTEQWRAAREIIDWGISGQSIFTRKRPLAPSTVARIAAGLRKFGGEQLEPFLVVFRHHQDGSSIDKPAPTLTAGGTHLGLCQPFILQQQSGGVARSTEEPLPTVATKGAIALVEPFLVRYQGSHRGKSDGDRRVHAIGEPLPTQDTSNRYGLCEPFIFQLNHGSKDFRSHSLDNPMPTLTTVDAWGLAQPFLVKYFGTAMAQSVDEPLDTVTTKDRFGLVQPRVDGMALDIHFRMLQPHELAAAMSFPTDYRFSGNRENKVKQIGNAVPVRLATALCRSLLEAA